MIVGVQDVYYNVEDMSRAVGFYKDVLGLKKISEDEYWSAFDVGGFILGLHWTGGSAVPTILSDDHGPFAGASLTLKVDDIESEVAELKFRGVKFRGSISDNPWGKNRCFRRPRWEPTQANASLTASFLVS